MSSKKFFNIVSLIIAVSMLLAACAPKATPTQTEAPAATTAPQATTAPAAAGPDLSGLKFAILTSGPKDDNSWNEAAFLGSEALKAYGAQTAFSERIAEGDELRILREYADQGYNMIVAHGFGYQDGVFQVASEFPDINFAWAGGINHTAKNVGDYDQPFYQAAYPIGVLAGYMSKTGTLGALYGFDIPVCHAMGEAFLAGAKSVNPKATLITTAVGVWEDVAAAKEAALAQADAGVDFWIECGEGPALGAIEAAKERGGFVTGYVGDMSENGPEVVLANVYWNLEPLFLKMMEQTKDKSFDNPFYQMGMKEGSVQVKLNKGLEASIPADALAAMNKAIADIQSGAFEVPYVPQAVTEPTPTAAPAAAGPDLSGLKFAILTSGPKDDNSWNEAAFLGSEALKAYGAQTAFSERIAEGDELRILREYADQGYNMIVAHGFGYQDGVFQVASEFPDINFAWAGGINHTAKNVGDYDQPFYQAAYPIGVLAGYMSKTGTLGALYGFDIPVCHAMGEAFLAGAKSVNPKATLITTAVGVWEDVAAAKEAALAQADAGVDFWIECGEGPALGAIEAAKERGGFVTGYVGDMSENGPEVVLANVYWNLEPLFLKMMEQTKDKSFDNPFYQMGMKEGSVQVKLNKGLEASIPADALAAMNKAIADIQSGAFVVPYVPAVP